ncbi:MAG: hypothetical protein KBT11_05690 [Treponema sp.]|nr:hypothetical protein [Candidatus Treponema equifaecale]
MKKISFLLIALFLSAFAYSQAVVNPNDDFYDEAQSWELRGLLNRSLPQLRPYPAPVVKEILESVIQNGNEEDAELAKSEYERNFGRVWHVSFEGTAMAKHSTSDKDGEKLSETEKFIVFEPCVYGSADLVGLASFGYSVGFYGANDDDYRAYQPYARSILHDSIYDPATLGPFKTYSDWNTVLAFGKENIYVTGGINRIGYGPFHREGLALNDSGYHSANILFNYTGEKFSYTQAIESIGATNNLGGDLSDNKFLVFHSLRYDAAKWLSVSYYENILFGPGFDLTYMLPAPMMAIQNIGGADSNLQMGLLFEVKPADGLVWGTDIFVDDYSVNDFVKLNFDAKYRFAFQTGLVCTPSGSILRKLTANYTCVMPYVYSHWEYAEDTIKSISGNSYNYQNYTNNAINIGSQLEPNSDGFNFKAMIKPAKNLSLSVSGAFYRHANSAEDFGAEDAAEYVLAEKGQYASNGTAFMHQMVSRTEDGNHVTQAWDKLGFMTSEHKKYVTQLGLDAEYALPKSGYGQLSLKLGYVFEYIKNANIDTNVFEGGMFKIEENDGTYSLNGSGSYSREELRNLPEVQNEVKRQKEQWVANLYDKINHYISFSVKYSY